MLRRLDDLREVRQRPRAWRVVRQAAHVRIVAAVVRPALLREFGCVRQIRQAVGQIPSEVPAERRAANLGAALDELTAARSATGRIRRVPEAREVGFSVRLPRCRCGHVGCSVGISGHLRCRIFQPLAVTGRWYADRCDDDEYEDVETRATRIGRSTLRTPGICPPSRCWSASAARPARRRRRSAHGV